MALKNAVVQEELATCALCKQESNILGENEEM